MFRKALLTCAALLFGSQAFGDVTLTVSSEGYDDFFKHCDIDFSHDQGDAISALEVTYHVLAGTKGKKICQQVENGFGCRESDDLEYTCEDVSRIDVLDVICKDAGGAPTPCGTVAVQAGEGISVPVEAAAMSPDVDNDLRIFATVLGFDDFFDDCEMGFSYQPMSRFDHVEVGYEVMLQDEAISCTASLSRHSGTGRSCASMTDYTCDQVTGVEITEVTCEMDDAEQDCGAVELRAIEKGFFKDAR